VSIIEREHQERERRAHDGGGDARASIEARLGGCVDVIAR
jgi:hypothetical protein